ncbi:MAG: hypothetical protein U0174_23580 [Polyangiaceae bacterium]
MRGTANRRGSPEAVAKRRAARKFNDVALGAGAASGRLDGRTEKRRQRLLKEVAQGHVRGVELKPVDVLLRLQELLGLGETIATLRKTMKARKVAPLEGERVEQALMQLHEAYAFPTEIYRFIGVSDDTLRSAGVLVSPKARRR